MTARTTSFLVLIGLVLSACSGISYPPTTIAPTTLPTWTSDDYSRAMDYCVVVLPPENCPQIISAFREVGCDPENIDILTSAYLVVSNRMSFAVTNTEGLGLGDLYTRYPDQAWGYYMTVEERKIHLQQQLDQAWRTAGCPGITPNVFPG